MKRPSFQFYPGDYLRDSALRSCSVAARGLWMDMLCYMHDGYPYGYLKVGGKVILPLNLSRMVGATLSEVEGWMKELFEAGVYSINDDGCIYCRRMIRDEEIRLKRSAGGILGGNPALNGSKDKVNLPPNLKPTPAARQLADEDAVKEFCNREGIPKGMRTPGIVKAWQDWCEFRSQQDGKPLNNFTRREHLAKLEHIFAREAETGVLSAISQAISGQWKQLKERHELHGQLTNHRGGGNQEAGTRSRTAEIDAGKISVPVLNAGRKGAA
jgi:hypothetical protein